MASIRREIELDVPAARAWSALRKFDNAANLFAGVLTHCEVMEDTRAVTFANGMTVHERLISLDEQDRKLVYSVLDGPFTQHNASMQIVPSEAGCRFLWISEFQPDEVEESVMPLV